MKRKHLHSLELKGGVVFLVAWNFDHGASIIPKVDPAKCAPVARSFWVSLALRVIFWSGLEPKGNFGAFCLDVRTLTSCQSMGFLPNH